MRGTFDFDPMQYDYGPATRAVRQILLEWAAVDWFVPPRDGNADALATQLFDEHIASAGAHAPELFPASTERLPVRSNWAAFSALCARVRGPGSEWDWKFNALKKLSVAHSKLRGWDLDDQAQPARQDAALEAPRPGALFFRYGDVVLWMGVSPKIDLAAGVPSDHLAAAAWYRSYADMDMTEALEWQLAEKSDRLDGNPFLPLLRCYAAGFYPFALGPTSFVLFAFS